MAYIIIHLFPNNFCLMLPTSMQEAFDFTDERRDWRAVRRSVSVHVNNDFAIRLEDERSVASLQREGDAFQTCRNFSFKSTRACDQVPVGRENDVALFILKYHSCTPIVVILRESSTDI